MKCSFFRSAPATSPGDFIALGAFQVLFDVQGPTPSNEFEVGRFNLTINDDQAPEDDERFKVQLVQVLITPSSLPVIVSSEEAEVTIIDDDR